MIKNNIINQKNVGKKNTAIAHHQLTLIMCKPLSITNIINNVDDPHPSVVVVFPVLVMIICFYKLMVATHSTPKILYLYSVLRSNQQF